MRVIGYARVSTAEQARGGLSLEAQRKAIRTEAEHRGWDLVEVLTDVASGKSTNGRHGLHEARDRLRGGEADALVVTRLDRLSRSLSDFAAVMEQTRKEGWQLVVLDLGVDTTTPTGSLLAGQLALFAEWERQLISERTREALAVKKAQGFQLGRPSPVPPRLRGRMRGLRTRGWSYRQIADRLNEDGIPGSDGGRWWPMTVRRIVAGDPEEVR